MRRIFVALPVINENELLPEVIHCLKQQSYKDFTLYICINQPDEWWDLPDKRFVCEENAKTLAMLADFHDFDLVVLDKSSKGNGWQGKKHGVGWARKTLMDEIVNVADDEDYIVSLDADTTFDADYLRSIVINFSNHPDAVGLSLPYYHLVPDDPEAARAILRYEIYMRHYVLNLWRIGSPYAFAALGSAMACPVWAYKAVGGMTPKMSGEDFYFLQKLRKYGRLLFHNEEKVYPAARFSNRVYFGTGPAMIRGNEGDWGSYPIYPNSLFDEVAEVYQNVASFYHATQESPFTQFLSQQFKESDPFEPIRRNAPHEQQFVRAFHEKVDGLRILQYLKKRNEGVHGTDEGHLVGFVRQFYPMEVGILFPEGKEFSFQQTSIEQLDVVRQFLFRKEEEYQVSSSLL